MWNNRLKFSQVFSFFFFLFLPSWCCCFRLIRHFRKLHHRSEPFIKALTEFTVLQQPRILLKVLHIRMQVNCTKKPPKHPATEPSRTQGGSATSSPSFAKQRWGKGRGEPPGWAPPRGPGELSNGACYLFNYLITIYFWLCELSNLKLDFDDKPTEPLKLCSGSKYKKKTATG